MRVLVTGGAGFIGSHVVDAFIEAGHEVAVLDNFSSGKRENINAHVFEVFEGDITDAVFLASVLKSFAPDVVNHHAAQISVTVSTREPLYDAHTNILGTLTLLEAMREHAPGARLIYATSGGAMYGAGEVGIPFTEESPQKPLSHYGLSKCVAEQYVWLYHRLHGLAAVVLRYANVFGPRQDPHGEAGVCAIFSERMQRGDACTIFGDGSQVRDYVFVKDVARANVLALEFEGSDYFNIGSGVPTNTRAVFDTLAKHFSYTKPVTYAAERIGDLAYSLLDTVKATNILSWKQIHSFDEATALTAQWYFHD